MAAIAAIVVALFTTGVTSAVWAQKADQAPANDKTTAPAVAKSESWVDRLEAVLSDKSKDADQRISEALAMLKHAKASDERTVRPPSATIESSDREPWFDEELESDVFAPSGGQFDPWREMQDLRARMDRMFQKAWRRMSEQARHVREFAGRFTPMGEFEEKDNAYIYRFDLPGVNKDDVKVTVENGRLTVEGKRESRVDESRKGFARREIFFGHFRRDIALPADADAAHARTKLDNGVLTIEVPRLKNAAAAKKQEIKVE